MPQNLIRLVDIKNREFLVVADHLVSFRSLVSKKTPGNNSYVLRLSDGSEITVLQAQCDRIVNSGLFKILKT